MYSSKVLLTGFGQYLGLCISGEHALGGSCIMLLFSVHLGSHDAQVICIARAKSTMTLRSLFRECMC